MMIDFTIEELTAIASIVGNAYAVKVGDKETKYKEANFALACMSIEQKLSAKGINGNAYDCENNKPTWLGGNVLLFIDSKEVEEHNRVFQIVVDANKAKGIKL